MIKHFPLSNHKFAHQGAMAALAAGQQGKFWEFHGQLLENHHAVSEEKIEQIAAGLGLDMARFNQDRQSESNKQLIREDIENGRGIGIRGTPTVFLNGKQVKNPGDLPELIRRELRK